MAFVADNSPDQTQQQTGQNPLSQQAPITSAPNAGSAGGATAKPTNSAPAQPFTNLSSYLSANAPQITSEANNIAGNLTNQYGQTTGAIDQAGQQFNQSVNSGYTPLNQNVISNVESNPSAVAADPTQSAQFTGMYNDQYTGPASFESSSYYNPLSTQVQNGTAAATEVGTVPGLQAYLSQGNPTYTQGESNLDSVLLNGNPAAVSTIQAAAAPYANLPGYLSTATSNADANVAAANQQAQAAQVAAQNGMQTAQTNVDNTINSEEAAAVQAAQNYNAQVQAAQAAVANEVPQANSLQQIMQQYGASFNNGVTAPWIDPSTVSIPQQVISLPGVGTVATPQDYANVAALEQLAGGVPFSTPINPAQASQAGTFQTPGAVDESQLTNALQALQQFILNGANNEITVGSSGNLNPFVTAANQWYNTLDQNLGYKYPGTGPRPAPFSAGGGTTIQNGGTIPGGV